MAESVSITSHSCDFHVISRCFMWNRLYLIQDVIVKTEPELETVPEEMKSGRKCVMRGH